MCSNMNKPNGQFQLPSKLDEITAWLAPQSVRRLFGIGKVTAQQLVEGYNISICEDVVRN